MNRVSRRILLPTLLAGFTLGFSGCAGYQLGSVKPTPYQGINRLHIPTFKNDTLEPRTAAIVTNSIIKQVQMDGTYEVTSKDRADAILEGRISRVERRQLRAAETDTLRTTEMRLFIIVEWRLVDPTTGQQIDYAATRDRDEAKVETGDQLRQRPGRVIGQTIQFLDPNFQLSERNAIPLAAEDAAEQLVGQLSNGW